MNAAQLTFADAPTVARDPVGELDRAIHAALPCESFGELVARVRERIPEADVCELDATARALEVEHGPPGRFTYARLRPVTWPLEADPFLGSDAIETLLVEADEEGARLS